MTREDITRMAQEAKLIQEAQSKVIHPTPDALERLVELARADEREACAKVCDELAARDKLSNYYAVAAKAIRARGNT